MPKGPSDNPDDKRFAAETEDHPFEYAGFEGVIPQGQYGAGEMLLWDIGTWLCDESAPLPTGPADWFDPEFRAAHEAAAVKAIENGKLSMRFRGDRLKGSYALVKTKEGWLFFKHNDSWARKRPTLGSESKSVLTGRTWEDLARGSAPKIPDPAILQPHGMIADPESLALLGPQEGYPTKLLPMKAEVGERPFSDPNWIFEPKMDGIRALALCQGNEVHLITRSGKDQTSQFPEVAAHLKMQNIWAVLDGEIVAFEDGRPGFTPMMKRFHLKDGLSLAEADRTWPCVFYAFDLLHREGCNLRGLPLRVRKRLLRQMVLPTERVQVVEHLEQDGALFYAAVVAAGFEGMMAKRGDSRYDSSGTKSPTWLKLKHTSTGDFVVGGVLPGEGSRADTFGSLAIGEWEEGRLIYRGRVGSGFDAEELARLTKALEPLKTKKNPFANEVETPDMLRWVKPEMVVELKYSELMPTGHLRSPVYIRQRPDAEPSDAIGVQGVRTSTPQEVRSEGPMESDPVVDAVLAQLDGKGKNPTVQIGNIRIAFTNLDKVLWPATETLRAWTKRDLLQYLARVSPFMLPHLADRPLTLIRYPNGIAGEKFYQKHVDMGRPDWVRVQPMWSDTNKKNLDYVVVDSVATLLWLGQLGTLEFHVPAARLTSGGDAGDLPETFEDSEEAVQRSVFNYPDTIRFDLDPYIYSGKEAAGEEPELNRDAFEKTKTAAFWLRDMLQPLGMTPFVKTTGKTGLHIFVPIQRHIDTQGCRQICAGFCTLLEKMHPRAVTTEWSVPKRTGKVFLDYNMNAMGKTLGAAYAPRAQLGQGVSMPLTWEELENAYPDDFTMASAFELLNRRGDVWAGILDAKVDLVSLVGSG